MRVDIVYIIVLVFFKYIFRFEGVLGFYRGFGLVIFGVIFSRVVFMIVLEIIKVFILKVIEKLDVLEVIVVVMVNGFVGLCFLLVF